MHTSGSGDRLGERPGIVMLGGGAARDRDNPSMRTVPDWSGIPVSETVGLATD